MNGFLYGLTVYHIFCSQNGLSNFIMLIKSKRAHILSAGDVLSCDLALKKKK